VKMHGVLQIVYGKCNCVDMSLPGDHFPRDCCHHYAGPPPPGRQLKTRPGWGGGQAMSKAQAPRPWSAKGGESA
jgi:hypothetical protein